LLLALTVLISLGLILANHPSLISKVSAQSPFKSINVQLAGDPVVVAKARAAAAGQSFNANTYRQQVINEQQQFLARLTAAGVPYTVSSVTAPNGPVTPRIEFRFNYVYNGIALDVPEATLPTIAAIQGVAGVFPNSEVVAHLDHAVDYTLAPQLYGNPPRLTGFDTLNTGGLQGDGVHIAVIDPGAEWSHEMFGGDPTPPQYGAAPAVALTGTNKK